MRTRRAWTSLSFLLLAPAAPGCQPDPGDQDPDPLDPPRSEISDSTGIRIVENARPAEGSRLGWLVGPEQSLSIGVVEGEASHMFSGVVRAASCPMAGLWSPTEAQAN